MMTTKKYFALLAILIVSVSFFSCGKDKVSGNGKVVTEKRSVANFYNVQVNGNPKLYIKSGTGFSVEVKGYENILPKLETEVENGTLRIQFGKDVNIDNDNSEVFVTMPSLVSVISQGNSDINISGDFIGMDIFSINKAGLGNVSVESGAAKNFKLDISGNGNFSGFGMSVENAIINVTGNGNTEVSVSKNLNVTINGDGILYYKGDPQLTKNITGNGKVVKK